MKKKGDAHGELTFLMRPSSSFLLVNSAAAWISLHAKGYTLQLMVSGAPSFSQTAKSLGQDGGNRLVAFSENSRACHW